MNSSSSAKRTPVPIGKYFLDSGRITGDQLEEALDFKHDNGGKLGQALCALGFVTEAELVEALRQQRKIHCVNLRPELVDTQVALEFGEARSRKFRALAINRIADYITVAMEDPADVYAIDAMTRHLGARIWPVFAEPSKIEQSIDYIFSNRVVPTSIFDLELGSSLTVRRNQPLPDPSLGGGGRANLLRLGPREDTLAAFRSSSEPSSTRPEGTVDPLAEPEDEPEPERMPEPRRRRRREETSADEATRNLIKTTLQEAFLQGASDVHLEPRSDAFVMRYRTDGMLFDRARLEKGWQVHLIRGLKRMANLQTSETRVPQEGRTHFSYKGRTIEIRIGILPSVHGEGAVVTLLEGRRPLRSLDGLELLTEQQADLERAIQHRDGLVLATGPAKSGRTTTLYALLEQLSRRNKKVVTLEDPVDHVLEGAMQINVAPGSGLGFDSGLRSVLRMDPDVVLVDEIRQPATAEIAAEGALAGHLLMSTMHTAGAVESISRLMELGVDQHLIADTLRCVVGQRLLRRVCRGCSQAATVDQETAKALGLEGTEQASFVTGAGCDTCMGTGYKGRVAVFEVLSVGAVIRESLRSRASMEEVHRAALETGMITLQQAGLHRARAGLTTLEEVLSTTNRA